MSNDGGINALRGFRKQFLHTLQRIVTAKNGECFYPEGVEDIDVYDSNAQLLERVQVKDYQKPLKKGHIDTFLERSRAIAEENKQVSFILASYGELGTELLQLVESDEKTIKKPKFKNYQKVLQRFHFEKLDEQNELAVIKNFLVEISMLGGNWQDAFDLLMQDLYRGSEEKAKFTYQSVTVRLQQIGKYLTGRKAHHQEWNISILPLEEQEITTPEVLRDAFNEGISASWTHIIAGLDVVRTRHLKKIEAAFKNNKIVVIHGASGQGKSALAYRYLHDYCPISARYEIRDLSTAKRALEIAAAIAGYNIPITFYVDAAYKDKGLPEFLRRIVDFPRARCLVTIREEDWRLIDITAADFKFADIELTFTQDEAREIYAALENNVNNGFPDFEQAWIKFSEAGPLLEFVHLLTHTETLKIRLRQQYEQVIRDIERKERPEHDLKLLEYVAIIGAYGARLDLAKLKQANVIAACSLRTSLNRLENEYFLRGGGEAYLSALHPLRANLLTQIISDDAVLSSWKEIALECLQFVADEDIEFFLLHSFVSHPDATEEILNQLHKNSPLSWTAIGGIVRALLWKGVKDYTLENRELFEEVYQKLGFSFWLGLDWDLLEISGNSSEKPIFLDILAEDDKLQLETWYKRQTPKKRVFKHLDHWLSAAVFSDVNSCKNNADWQAFGQVVYWVGFRKLNITLINPQDLHLIEQAIKSMSLESLANLIYGLWNTYSKTEDFSQWYQSVRPQLLQRYKEETVTPSVEESENTIRAHFIVPIKEKPTDKIEATDRLNHLAIEHVHLLHQLIPEYTTYACQGYGHALFDFMEYDETAENITDKNSLLPDWVKQVNVLGNKLSRYLFRPQTWRNYSEQILDLRNNILLNVDALRKNLALHFCSKNITPALITQVDSENWQSLKRCFIKTLMFPLDAIDPFGFTGEQYNPDIHIKTKQDATSGYLQRYKPYLTARDDFFRGLSNFINQAPDYVVAYSCLGKAEDISKVYQAIAQNNLNIKNPAITIYNLTEALKNLPKFQKYYRQHFEKFSDPKKLSKLEEQESAALYAVWCLWFFFINEPKRQWTSPQQSTQKLLNERKQALQINIKKALIQCSTETLAFKYLGDEQAFDDETALWISINGENPLEVYNQLPVLFGVLKQALGEIKRDSLEYYALELQWQNIMVILLCQGKLLHTQVWKIPTYRFLAHLNSDNTLSPLDYFMHEIDLEKLVVLKLELWNLDMLQDAWSFFQKIANLQLHIKHLLEFKKLPSVDEMSNVIIQSYVETIQDDLSKDTQQLLDLGSKLAQSSTQLMNLVDKDNYMSECLVNGTRLFIDAAEKLVLEELDGTPRILNLEMLKIWHERIVIAQGECFAAYLFWCHYLIHKK